MGGFLGNSDSNTKLIELINDVRLFLRERDWEKFHNPKSLAESICIEATELLQIFQWMNQDELASLENEESKIKNLKEELADVMIYCLSMANSLKIDVTSSILEKLDINRQKYPVKLFHGNAHL